MGKKVARFPNRIALMDAVMAQARKEHEDWRGKSWEEDRHEWIQPEYTPCDPMRAEYEARIPKMRVVLKKLLTTLAEADELLSDIRVVFPCVDPLGRPDPKRTEPSGTLDLALTVARIYARKRGGNVLERIPVDDLMLHLAELTMDTRTDRMRALRSRALDQVRKPRDLGPRAELVNGLGSWVCAGYDKEGRATCELPTDRQLACVYLLLGHKPVSKQADSTPHEVLRREADEVRKHRGKRDRNQAK
jgi:hypothetical protein